MQMIIPARHIRSRLIVLALLILGILAFVGGRLQFASEWPWQASGGVLDPNGVAVGSTIDPNGLASGSGIDPNGLAAGSSMDPMGLTQGPTVDPNG